MFQNKTILRLSLVFNVVLSTIFSLYYFKNKKTIKPYSQNQNSDTVTYFCEKNRLFKNLNIDSNDIVFLGDSFIDNYPASEIFNDLNIKNRGIQGAQTASLINLIDSSFHNKPSKIFVYIGINDIIYNVNQKTSVNNYKLLINKIKEHTPKTSISFISILPIKNDSKYCSNCNKEIISLNKKIEELCKSENVNYLNFYDSFASEGEINSQYTIKDGLHLNEIGYKKLTDLLKEFI